MKKETFETAQVLNCKIEDLGCAIAEIEANKKSCDGALPINLKSFSYDEEYEAVKQNTLRFMKARKAKYQKQFDDLK